MKYKHKLLTIKDIMESEEQINAFIFFNGGARCIKVILYDPKNKRFLITNEIDDTEQSPTAEQSLTLKQINNRRYSNIGYAIKRKAFFAY